MYNISECPKFEYDGSALAKQVLREESLRILSRISLEPPDQLLSLAADTRAVHHDFFARLAPDNHNYFSGHYRGEDFPCLRYCEVKIGHDAGCPAHVVLIVMLRFNDFLNKEMASLDLHYDASTNVSGKFINQYIRLITFIFCHFLSIHPYANGNGHMSRVIFTALGARFGIYAPAFTITPRPFRGVIDDAVAQYRRGVKKPLEGLIANAILRRATMAAQP